MNQTGFEPLAGNFITMKFSYKLLAGLMLFACQVIQVQAQEYGLFFSSYDSLMEKRTELILFPEGDALFKEEFKLSFDISLQQVSTSYGYIFRAILDGDNNIDLILAPRAGGGRNLFIIHKSEQTSIAFGQNLSDYQDRWVNINTVSYTHLRAHET